MMKNSSLYKGKPIDSDLTFSLEPVLRVFALTADFADLKLFSRLRFGLTLWLPAGLASDDLYWPLVSNVPVSYSSRKCSDR